MKEIWLPKCNSWIGMNYRDIWMRGICLIKTKLTNTRYEPDSNPQPRCFHANMDISQCSMARRTHTCAVPVVYTYKCVCMCIVNVFVSVYVHAHMHTYIYIYIYIYMCVCVCVCVYVYHYMCKIIYLSTGHVTLL